MSIAHPGPSNVWAGSADPANIATPASGIVDAGFLGTPAPIYQFVNWMFKYLFQGVRHLLTRGIPDYNATESYAVGDRVQGSDNKSYRCIQANTPAAAKDPTTQAAYWTCSDCSGVTSLTGASTSQGSIASANLIVVGGMKIAVVNIATIPADQVGANVALTGAMYITALSVFASISNITNHPNAYANAYESSGDGTTRNYTIALSGTASAAKNVTLLIVGT